MAATISIDGGRVGVVLHRDIRVAVRGRLLDRKRWLDRTYRGVVPGR